MAASSTADRVRDWRACVRASGVWLTAHRIDLGILVVLAAVASAIRLTMLTEIPLGLHGDEAWTGIDARRVLDEGWIGPYVRSASGQPTGVMYVAAPFVQVFGETIFAVRIVSVVLGVATVLASYLAFRVSFDRPTASFTATILAISLWHIHFSRTAFTLIAWPLVELAVFAFLLLGLKTRQWWWFALAGLLLGAGVYTYNAYPVFAAAVGIFLGVVYVEMVLRWRQRKEEAAAVGRFVVHVCLLGICAAVVALPLILYALDGTNDYRSHHDGVSYLNSEQWGSAGLFEKAEIVGDRYRDFLDAVFWSGRPDVSDGAGEHAMVSRVTLVLVVIGSALTLRRWRRPESWAVLILLIVIPLGSVLTIGATYRRSFGMVPFVALLAAVPLAAIWNWAGTLRLPWRPLPYAAIAAIIGAIAFLNLSFYFGDFRDSDVAIDTFGPAMTEASDFIDTLPEETYIYFYSPTWSYDYETRRFLAPDHKGQDRAPPFSDELLLVADHQADLAYVFTGYYADIADEVAGLYPGGTLMEGDAISVYTLPELAQPDEGPLSAQARERDSQRIDDLMAVGRALDLYRSASSAYPSTSRRIETLCEDPADSICVLVQSGGQLPNDPLAKQEGRGYWYASDGVTYVLYAQAETEAFEACLDPPEELLEFGGALLCVSGG